MGFARFNKFAGLDRFRVSGAGGIAPALCAGWILFTGTWTDTGTWADTCTWSDA